MLKKVIAIKEGIFILSTHQISTNQLQPVKVGIKIK